MTLLKNKIVKRVLIIFGSLFGLLIILLIIAQIVITSNKPKILAKINEALSKSIKGHAEIKDVDVSVWKSFLDVSVSIKGIRITDSVYHKPLVSIQQASTSLSLFKLITKTIDIHELTLKNGIVHFFTDTAGYSNSYLIKGNADSSKPSENKNKSDINIDELNLENITFVTENAKKHKWFGVRFNKLHADIDKSGDEMEIEMREDALVKGLGFNTARGYYIKDKILQADWDLTFNLKTKQFSFKETPVKINNHEFLLVGDFFFTPAVDSPHFAIKVKTNQVDYREAISLLPLNIQKKVSLGVLNKPIDVTAAVSGSLLGGMLPLVKADWKVKNNELVLPGIVISNCNFDGNFYNEIVPGQLRTDENTRITLNGFAGNWDGVLLGGGKVTVTNLITPTLKFSITSACTLDALDNKFALNTLKFSGGTAYLRLNYEGPISATPLVLQNLTGQINLTNGSVRYEPKNLTFTNCNGRIIFESNALHIDSLKCDLNTNHFEVTVEGNNTGNLALTNLGAATIVCKVFTPSLNLGDFKTLFETKRTYIKRSNTNKGGALLSANKLDDILANGAVDVNIKANAIKYNKFAASNVVGNISFRNDNWNIQQVSLQHANGTLNLSGNIRQLSPTYHLGDIKLNVANMDVKKVFYAFDNFGQDGIVSSNLKGTINTLGNVKIGFDSKGNIVPNSTDGYIDFSLRNGALVNFKPIQSIQKFIFKNRDLANIEFAELKDRIDLSKGSYYIHRMEIQSSALTAYVQGVLGNKENTDISIQVPLSNLKKRDSSYIPKNKGVDAKVGASVYLRGKMNDDGKVGFGVDVFKKFRKDLDIDKLLLESKTGKKSD